MNRELLLKVADAIEANPQNFNMAYWVTHWSKDGRRIDPTDDYTAELEPCKTTACIAGWALSLAEKSTLDLVCERYPEHESFPKYFVASKILGLSEYQTDTLFYEQNWRNFQLLIKHRDSNIPEIKAQAAAEYIRWFVGQEEKGN